jgi:hypothetical protein
MAAKKATTKKRKRNGKGKAGTGKAKITVKSQTKPVSSADKAKVCEGIAIDVVNDNVEKIRIALGAVGKCVWTVAKRLVSFQELFQNVKSAWEYLNSKGVKDETGAPISVRMCQSLFRWGSDKDNIGIPESLLATVGPSKYGQLARLAECCDVKALKRFATETRKSLTDRIAGFVKAGKLKAKGKKGKNNPPAGPVETDDADSLQEKAETLLKELETIVHKLRKLEAKLPKGLLEAITAYREVSPNAKACKQARN